MPTYSMPAQLLATTTIITAIAFIAITTALPTLWSSTSASLPVAASEALAPNRSSHTTDLSCHALVENMPWQLTNITVLNTLDPESIGSSITFHFCDTNPGLEIETSCSLTVTPDRLSALDSSGGYQPCENNMVAFSYSPDRILVERAYQDECLGKPPYNHGIFFGQGKPDFGPPTRTRDGERLSQILLEIPITSQI